MLKENAIKLLESFADFQLSAKTIIPVCGIILFELLVPTLDLWWQSGLMGYFAGPQQVFHMLDFAVGMGTSAALSLLVGLADGRGPARSKTLGC